MLGVLIRRQFLELYRLYLTDKKSGKTRSAAGTAVYLLLFVLLLLLLGLGVYSMTGMFAGIMLGRGYDWLFFAFMGLTTVLLGLFGSVFSTYTSLYLAKDNEFLLSLPIPPSQILFSRMTGVFAMSLLYSAVAWIPSVIRYLKTVPESSGAFPSIVLLLCITVLVSALTCFFGWLVAMISRKAKGKSYLTVFLSLLFFGGYYYAYHNFSKLLASLAEHVDQLRETFRGRIYPLYLLGTAAEGNITSLLLFAALCAVAFVICWFVMSRSFLRVATASNATGKRRFREKEVRAAGLKTALFRRELKRFGSSAVYMLNCGLGVLFLPAAAILCIIKRDFISVMLDMLRESAPSVLSYLPAGLSALICLIIAMNVITVPAVSLEGKNLWIVRSLPCPTREVLRAKELLHIVINAVPVVVSAAVLSILLQLKLTDVLTVLVVCLLYITLTAVFGLILGILRPILIWTNESVPVKQNLAVLIAILGNLLFVVFLGAGAYFLRNVLPIRSYLLLTAALLAVLTLLLQRWVDTKGVQHFEAM